MKKTLLLTLFVLAAFTINAQVAGVKCPSDAAQNAPVIQQRSNALDFTTTFTDGTSAGLYTTLTAGNCVVLDFFFTT
jgi:cytochrome oxidase Cu insertion factor (SCO1/SenC/PrrC family)